MGRHVIRSPEYQIKVKFIVNNKHSKKFKLAALLFIYKQSVFDITKCKKENVHKPLLVKKYVHKTAKYPAAVLFSWVLTKIKLVIHRIFEEDFRLTPTYRQPTSHLHVTTYM